MSPFEDTIIDHLNIGVSDAERSCAFYEKALAPLGLKLLHSIPPENAELGGEQAKLKGPIFGFGRQYKPLSGSSGMRGSEPAHISPLLRRLGRQ